MEDLEARIAQLIKIKTKIKIMIEIISRHRSPLPSASLFRRPDDKAEMELLSGALSLARSLAIKLLRLVWSELGLNFSLCLLFSLDGSTFDSASTSSSSSSCVCVWVCCLLN